MQRERRTDGVRVEGAVETAGKKRFVFWSIRRSLEQPLLTSDAWRVAFAELFVCALYEEMRQARFRQTDSVTAACLTISTVRLPNRQEKRPWSLGERGFIERLAGSECDNAQRPS